MCDDDEMLDDDDDTLDDDEALDDETLPSPEAAEYFFSCPSCGQRISVLVDPSIENQSYIEDCEMCCNPIQITYTVDAGEVIAFDAESTEQ